MATDWIQALATLGLLIVSGALVFQLREMRNSRRKADATMHLREWHSPEVKKAREYIYTQELPDDPSQLSPKEFKEIVKKIHPAIATMNNLGYLVEKQIIDRNVVMAMSWSVFIRCGRKLKPYVQQLEELAGGEYYLQYFKALVKRAEKYKAKNFPEVEVKIY